MLLFGHAGITLGIAVALNSTASRETPLIRSFFFSRLASLVKGMDYRLVLLGAILPDIIDKPVGHIFLADQFDNYGRIYGHTLLFFLILFSIGVFRHIKSGKNGFLLLSICSGGHLLLDSMWKNTQTLFWPFDGWSFPKGADDNVWEWVSSMSEGLASEMSVLVPEIIGVIVCGLVAFRLYRKGQIQAFLKHGKLK